MCEAERRGRLSSSWGSGEEAVGHRSSLDKLFETRNDLFLIYNLVQSLGPIFLSPESSFQQGRQLLISGLIQKTVSLTSTRNILRIRSFFLLKNISRVFSKLPNSLSW